MEKYRCGHFYTVYTESSYLGGVHHGVNVDGTGKGLEGVRVYMNCIPGCSKKGPARLLVRDEKGNYHCPECGIIRVESHSEKEAQESHLSSTPDWWIKESKENGRPL